MELTKEQQDFLNTEGRIVLCAVPGSGKTFIVAKKLISYLKEWKYLHRGVAALSFTNVASDEIKRQITDSSQKTSEMGYPHFVGTLDSFINNFILLRFGYLMQKENRIRPIIIHENFGQLTFLSKDARCHQQMCTQHPEWFHWSSTGLQKDGKSIECDVNPKPCIAYKKALLKRGMVIQREVPSLSLLLLKKYPQIAKELAYRFPVIIVDEAQDTSREQMEILDCIAQAGVQTMVLVGDPDQSLYEWRDATPEYFKNKMNDGNWTCMYLSANFRSSQLICNAVQPFSSILNGKSPAAAKGECANYLKKPVLFSVPRDKSKEDIILAFLNLCRENEIKISSKNIAVLTRGKIHSDIIPDIWKTPETELLAKATFCWHCSSRKEAYLLCEKVLYSIEVGNITGLTHEEIISVAEAKFTPVEWKAKIISLLKILPQPTVSIADWKSHMLSTITEQIGAGIIKPYDDRNAAGIIKVKLRDKKHPDFLQHKIIEYFEKRSETDMTISSVHGVKGETFDATLLIVDSTRGANALTPTVLNTGDLNSELIRIAYVAMTRPRKLLVVSIPKTSKELSRFPTELWDYQEI